MKRALAAAFLVLAAACGGSQSQPATQQGSIKDVVVVLKGSDEPLPFDPRGGRITIVTGEIKKLIGHHVVLELDSALSPELKSSFEETVLASFETIVRELVLLQKEDPEMFARAKHLERVVFSYDVVRKESEGALDGEKVLRVKTPPERYPLLEKWILSQAIYDAHITDLEARWGDADPTKLATREHAPYFAYMTKTRPGAGYLWTVARDKKNPGAGAGHDTTRVEHIGRIVKLASVVNPQDEAALARKIRTFLLEQLHFLGGFRAKDARYPFKADEAVLARVLGDYERWLNQIQATFDDEERVKFAREIYEHAPDVVFPGFDRFAYGLAIYDAWAKEGAKNELPPGPRGELYKMVVCPSQRRGEGETEIKWGCSAFFSLAINDDSMRARLSETIAKRKDTKLLETALFNHPHNGGDKTLALVESLAGHEQLFHHGFGVLFHDLARVDDVKASLEKNATRWWRDTPNRRGMALFIMARQTEGLHVHYGDNHWTRFVAEYGGPVRRDVFSTYLAEGPRAVEMTPKIWLALAKGAERDDLVAKSIPVLLERDRQARTSKATVALALLRTRLCEEKNANGLTMVKSSIDRWASEHPTEAASVSNARADFTLARCKEPPKERDD
jgi:hypothetical protein